MITRIFNFATTTLLVASPVMAQFGVAGNRKKAASFQELNEQAKKLQEGGGVGVGANGMGGFGGLDGYGGLDDLEELLNDPELMEEFAKMGGQMEEVMKMMANMSPEQLQQQMEDAMAMLTGGDMLESMLSNKEEILKTLEATQAVPPEELARFRTDPEYFDQKMRESMGQMKEIFNDPEIMKAATEGLSGFQELYNNPDALTDIFKGLVEGFDDDETIEQARLQLLSNPDLSHPALKAMFEQEDMKELLNDAEKWRNSVKEGQGMLTGAGVGEL